MQEDFSVMYASAAKHALRFADALDAEQRAFWERFYRGVLAEARCTPRRAAPRDGAA